jgi:hypothetical protein
VRSTTKPPKPRVSWDIAKFLDFIRERYDVDIGIAEQGRLVATLIALVLSWRPRSDLGRITLSSLLFSFRSGDEHALDDLSDADPPVSVTFSAWMPNEGDRKDCFLSAFEKNPCVCPAIWLFCYLKAASNRIKTLESKDRLFVSSQAPYSLATKDTIFSWVSQTLELCGITAQTHSTCALLSSFAADTKVLLEAVLSSAN